MPYASDRQRRFFHSPGAAKAGITKKEIGEFDSASKGMKLPEKAKKMAEGGIAEDPNQSKYRFVDEGDSHFVVENPETGQQLPIAKNSLSTSYQKQIRELPKAEVPQPEESPIPQTPTLDPRVVAALQEPSPPEAPMAQAPQIQQPLNPAIAQALAPAPKPAPDPFAMQQAVNTQRAAHESQGLQQQALAQQKLQEGIQNFQNAAQQRYDQMQKENDDLQNKVLTSKVDPERWWKDNVASQGFGTKLRVALGFILGGLSSGGMGRSNPYMDHINNMINRDIDAQKSNIDNQNNLLRVNLQKFGNLQQATSATYSQMLAMAQAQIGQIAANTQSQTVQDNARQANATLELQKQQYQHELALQHAQQMFMQGPGTTTADTRNQLFSLMPKEVQERAVKIPTPTGGLTYAPTASKEDADKIKDVYDKVQPVLSQIEEMKRFMGVGQGKGGENIETPTAEPKALSYIYTTDRRAQANNIRDNLKAGLKDLLGSGLRLNEYTNDNVLDKLVPDPGEFRRKRSIEELDRLEKNVLNKINAAYQSKIPGYTPLNSLSGFKPGRKPSVR